MHFMTKNIHRIMQNNKNTFLGFIIYFSIQNIH